MKEKEEFYKVIENLYYVEKSGACFKNIPNGNGGSFRRDYIANFTWIPQTRILEYVSPECDPHVYYKCRPLYKGRLGSVVNLDKEKLRKKNPDVYTTRGERVYPGPKKVAETVDMTIAQWDDEAIPEETQFTFMGMTGIEGKGPVFLNRGLSIDENGPTDKYSVLLPECYRDYKFIPNENNYLLAECIKTTIEILEKTWDPKVSIPTLAYSAGAVLNYIHSKHGNEDNSILNLLAKSGSGKSTLVKFNLSLYGIFPHAAPATISFADTSINALKTILCSAQYCLVLIDDVRMNETPKDKEKNTDKVNALSETAGNRSYKQILNGDSSLAPVRISHACPILTSEQELSLSPAANARMTTVEFDKDESALRRSFPYQKQLDKINITGQDWILFVIQHVEAIDKIYDSKMEYFSNLIPVGGHERITNNITHLMFNYYIWNEYLKYRKIINQAEFEEREKVAETLFVNLAAAQNERVKEESVSNKALSLIQSSLNSGRRYCQEINNKGGAIKISGDYKKLTSTSTCIGYIDRAKGLLYLDQHETFKAIEEYGEFPVSDTTLWKTLREEGKLHLGEPREKGKERRLCPKVTINGQTKRLLAVKLSAFDDIFESEEGGELYEG